MRASEKTISSADVALILSIVIEESQQQITSYEASELNSSQLDIYIQNNNLI